MVSKAPVKNALPQPVMALRLMQELSDQEQAIRCKLAHSRAAKTEHMSWWLTC